MALIAQMDAETNYDREGLGHLARSVAGEGVDLFLLETALTAARREPNERELGLCLWGRKERSFNQKHDQPSTHQSGSRGGRGSQSRSSVLRQSAQSVLSDLMEATGLAALAVLPVTAA